MTAQDITLLAGALGGVFTVLGGAARWCLVYINNKVDDAEKAADAARHELKANLESQIQTLTEAVKALSARENLYLRRVLQLEAFVQEKGLVMPVLEGWPPK